MTFVLPVLLLLLFFSSCSRRYKVEGVSSVTSLDGKMLFLKMYQGGRWLTVDSAEVVHGLFTMEGPADSARMVMLYMNDEAIMPLVLERGTVEVSITHSQLLAKGTLLNDRLYAFIMRRNLMEVQLEELERKEARMVLDGANVDEVHERLVLESDSLNKEMSMYVKTFIAENYENVLGPNVFMMLCSTLPYPMMTPQIEDIVRTAPLLFKENEQVKDFLYKAKENMRLIEEHRRLQENSRLGSID